MSVEVWIGAYLIEMLFWVWIVFLGGADRIEGSFVLDFVWTLSSRIDAEMIRFVGWIVMFMTTAWFILGLFVPLARLVFEATLGSGSRL
ncbi:MAG: hypothetical protein H6818_18025 [Phycisphaerales bacterium]|nr:hypothetical protein [Phycisphaerales bacterium]MCB9864857.1 hypothetical protein [Phycisphaerales bacterium]